MFSSFFICATVFVYPYISIIFVFSRSDFLFSLFVTFFCALFLLCLRVNGLCLVFCVMSVWRSVTSIREKDSGA